MDALIDQAGFPYPRVAHHRHHLTMPCGCPLARLPHGLELGLSPDKAGEPTGRGGLQAAAQGAGSAQLEDLYRL
jgi:hypothetical protein